MRCAILTASCLILVSSASPGCNADDDRPLFPSATTSGDAGGNDAGGNDAGDAGANIDAGNDAAPLTCKPDMGQTECDKCAYGQCCTEAMTCAAGTPCDALWTCARAAGCLDPQAADFDTCAVAACSAQATADAVAAIEALAQCIQTNCQPTCGG